MRPMRLRFAAFARVDWGRLVEHLTAALLLTVGGALVANSSEPFGPELLGALKLWFGAALVYAGGFIQDAERLDDDTPDKSVPTVVPWPARPDQDQGSK